MQSSFTISFMNDRATLGPRVWGIIRSSGWPPTTSWPGWNSSVLVSHAIAAQAEWYELPPLPPQVSHTAAKLASAARLTMCQVAFGSRKGVESTR